MASRHRKDEGVEFKSNQSVNKQAPHPELKLQNITFDYELFLIDSSIYEEVGLCHKLIGFIDADFAIK